MMVSPLEAPNRLPPRVLIVEDGDAIRSIWSQYLARNGIEVQSVPTAEAGLSLLDAIPVDLVLLDLCLDGRLSGEEFLQALAQRDRRPPVIVVSAFLTEEASARSLSLGACRLVRKPCTASDIYLYVRYLLRGPRGCSPTALLRAEFAHIRSLKQLAAVVGLHPHTVCRRIRAATRRRTKRSLLSSGWKKQNDSWP